MASFGKPIRRKTANQLVAGMLERARDYNTDANKPLYVERLRIFGSYLDRSGMSTSNCPSATAPGTIKRLAPTPGQRKAFRSFMAEITWPQLEPVQHLKNGSKAINITLENIDNITDHLRHSGRYVRGSAALRRAVANDRPPATRTPTIGEAPAS
jgi:hypothetical protein